MFLLKKLTRLLLSSDHDKRVQPNGSTGTYASGTNKDLVCKKKEVKCKNIVKQYKKQTLIILQKKT